MKKVILVSFVCCMLSAGCEGLRFAASENQKQNAYVHEKTAAEAARTARSEEASAQLQSLTRLSELQSRAFVLDYGLPEQLPQVETAEQVLAEENWQLAEAAGTDSTVKPDGWDLADALLETAIGISALVGGVYGTRAVAFLQTARTKSEALKEIVEGNELFKRQNPEQTQAFKDAQSTQSASTRQIVSGLKTN